MENKIYKNKCRNRIRELRVAKGFNSLREFTRFINNQLGFKVSIATISLLESHRRENPFWELIDVLANYFQVSTDYLMGRTDYNIKIKDEEHLARLKKQLPPEAEYAMQEFYKKMCKMYADREKRKKMAAC